MAYFETLGQLQNNDETFTEIYGISDGKGSRNITISGSIYNLIVGDIIMVLNTISTYSGSNNVCSYGTASILGATKRLEHISTYTTGGHTSGMYLYIGILNDNNLTINIPTSGAAINCLKVYRLVPR